MGRKIVLTDRDVQRINEIIAPTPRSFTPTPEQDAILDAFTTGEDLVVEAGAGAGKTSTLKLLARSDPDRRGIYLAYNKAIADEAAQSFPSTVSCRTAHSFAFRAVGFQFAHRLNGPRLPAREVARLLDIPMGQYTWGVPITSYHAARLVMETIEHYCHSADTEITEDHVPFVHGLQPEAQLILRKEVPPVARRAWEDLTNPDGALKFTHDCYLKMWGLSQPQLRADYVFLDEAQDANPVIADIVERQERQRILVGDSSQAIYGWRGAIDAMKNFQGKRLPLTQSFRFGPPIANEANIWLERIDAPIRLRGSEIDSHVGPLSTSSAILCRTNAGTVIELMRCHEIGRSATLVGSGAQIRALALVAVDLMDGKGTNHPELFMFQTWADLKEYVEHDKAGQDLRSFVKLIETHGPQKVIGAIDSMAHPSRAETSISTAHKAKGLEWNTVKIAGDFVNPSDLERPLTVPEMMLSYVAVTRAKHHIDLGSLADDYEAPVANDDDEG